MSCCLSPFWKQVFVVSGTCLNAIGNGCVMSFTAILLPKITDPESDIHVSESTASWVASTLGIGIIIGNVIVPFTMHRFGRKPSQILSTLLSIPAWFALASARNVATLIVAKCSQGLGMGIYSMLSPILIGEMTSSKDRGMFLGSISFGWTTGVFLGHLIGTLFRWRTTALICSTFQILALLITIFIPESPHWLLSKTKFDKSETSFRWLRGHNEMEIKELNSLILAQKLKETEKPNKIKNKNCCSTIIKVVKDKAFLKPLFIMLNMCLIFHGMGLDTITNSYCIMVLKNTIEFNDQQIYYYIMVTFGLSELLASVLVIFVSRRYNRRSCIFTANAIVILLLVLISLYLYLKSLQLTLAIMDWIPVVLLCLYSFTMYIGIYSFTFTIAGEIFPMMYKSISSLLVGTFMAIIYFAVVKSAPAMLSALGIHGTFLVYAGIGSICTLYLYFFLPETKGKTLQQIEEYFTGERVSELEVDEINAMLKANINKA